VPALQKKLTAAITEGWILECKIAKILHKAGINVRYLGLIRSLMEKKKNHLPRFIILCEVLARVVKNEIKLRMRETAKEIKAHLAAPYRFQLSFHLFN